MEIKFVSSSALLLTHLQAISKVISNKTTIPILDSFLFNVKDNQLSVMASDSETTMETSLELESVQGEGVFAVSAKILLDILKEFADQPLTFTVNSENMGIVINSSTGRFSIVGQQPDTYPVPPQIEEEKGSLNLPVKDLDEGIAKTFFAAADDVMRPGMSGVYIDYKSECLTFVASNAQKLTRLNKNAFQAPEGQEAAFILHRKPGAFLRSILAKEQGEVSIKFDKNNAFFTFSKFKMTCRLINSRFPNYAAIISTETPNEVVVDRLAFLSTLKRVSVFASQGTNLIKVEIEDNSLVVSAQDIDFSVSGTETLPCQYNGTPMSIGFNSVYLIEILQNIEDADEVSMKLSDPSRPGLIAPVEQKENENLVMLVMPLGLNE